MSTSIRAPWLSITITPAEGGVEMIRADCVMCGHWAEVPIDRDGRYVTLIAYGLLHQSRCPVPRRLARSAAARWN